MATENSDLWPEDLVVDVLSPTMILNEQAEALTKRTHGIVRGEVAFEIGDEFEQLAFDLYAPAFGFRHRLLYVRHLKDYPYPNILIATPLYRIDQTAWKLADYADPQKWKLSDAEKPKARCAYSPRDIESILGIVFSAKSTRSTLFSLIARSNDVMRVYGNRPTEPLNLAGNEAGSVPPTIAESEQPEPTP